MTRYYWEHREQCIAVTKAYRERNRDRILEEQRAYYQKTLKQRRRIDRLWANADKPPKIKKPKITKTIKYFGPVIEAPVKEVPIPEPKGAVTVQPGVTIDWS